MNYKLLTKVEQKVGQKNQFKVRLYKKIRLPDFGWQYEKRKLYLSYFFTVKEIDKCAKKISSTNERNNNIQWIFDGL